MHDQGLDLLLYIYKDLLSIQIGQEDQVVYSDLIDMLRQQSLQLSQKRVANHLVAILEAKKRIYANVNPQLLMEQLVLTLQEG
jgi:DNA polymerase III subunit delta'